MMSNLEFKTSSILEAEEYYKTIKISPDQRKKVEDFSRMIGQFLHLPERAIKGFFWRVLQNYQVKRHMLLDEAATLTPAERLEGLKEILSLLKKELTKILVTQDQIPELDAVFQKILIAYTSKK